MKIKGKTPKLRNTVNRIMCTDHRFRTKYFENKKKKLKKFDIRKEYYDGNQNGSRFLLHKTVL